MKLAILFWCYKNVETCVDRLRHLREQNPDSPIYVLFGGPIPLAKQYENDLRPYYDDFCVYEGEQPTDEHHSGYRGGVFWKYVHGDLMFAWWYERHGIHLEWDTVCIIQWDMLVFGPISEVFRCLKKDQILFSGLRPVKEVEDHWAWVAEPQSRIAYDHFLDHLRAEYGYDQEPMCCVAVVLCLPRVFLEKFVEIESPWLGGLEYRLPIYAQVFGIEFCQDHPFKPWWGAVEKYKLSHTLRARPIEIWIPTIALNLLKRTGARVFHPYWRDVPRGALGWMWAFADAFPRLLITTIQRRMVGNRLLRLDPPPEG